jgi:5-methylcytosine-specific restriction endonuclease McrA
MTTTPEICVQCKIRREYLSLLPTPCGYKQCPEKRQKKLLKNKNRNAVRGEGLPKPTSHVNRRIKEKLAERDGEICQLCGNSLILAEATLDHKIPRSKGGTRNLENLQLAHADCNRQRGNVDLAEWFSSKIN